MRIIAGEFKGRKLLPPPGLTTRPITDRVKTNLFNILLGRLEGAVVLDLFSGTGSLGLEALSRGARWCCFAERDRPALARLALNIDALRVADRCRVWAGDVMLFLGTWLAPLREGVDVAFIDPPYALVESWDWAEATEALFAPVASVLAPDGLAVLRCRRDQATPPTLGPLALRQRRDYGGMSLAFYGRAGEEPHKPGP